MQLTITINCNTKAFDYDLIPECSRILEVAIDSIRIAGVTQEIPLTDFNGKRIGSINWETL